MSPNAGGGGPPGRRLGVAAGRLIGVVLGLLLLVSGCTVTPPEPGPTSPPGPTRSTAGERSGSSPTTAPALPVGASEKALLVDNRIRMYRAYRPARLPEPAPLVVMLHGGLGSARLAELAYGWDALAEREGFVVLYPDSFGGAWNVGGGCCGIAPEAGVNDVGFVAAAIADLERTVTIDPLRRYAAGMSNGGMMTYRLACDTTLFAAIGPVAATQLGDCPNPAPISIMHVHGTADTTVPLDGSELGVASIVGPAIGTLLQTWRNTDRCGGTVERVEGRVTTSTAQCPSGRAVALVLVDGGGHAWPGVSHRGPLDASPAPTKATGASGNGTDPTASVAGPSSPPATGARPGGSGSATATASPTDTVDYDTSARLWAFFAARSR